MDSTLACLAAWMPRQRWYSAKGRQPSLRLVGWWDPPTPTTPVTAEDDARVRTFLVADEGTLPEVLYQVPVVARPTASIDEASDHIIGSPEPGTTLLDGPFDPAFTSALLGLVTDGGRGTGPRTTALGHPHATVSTDGLVARVLSGEQSNTSLIYRRDDGVGPIICKVFRQLHPGLNPDIELQSALADAGSPHVPGAIGSIEGTWPDSATAGGSVTGSLAFAQEFLPGVEDAWRVALGAASSGDDFRAQAHALGAATADVHLSLAGLFPTQPATPEDRESTMVTWRQRLAIAIAEVPAIASRREAVEAVYARAADTPWPALQRIHGDYHLGQVLQVPDRGWVLLDFEGEPLRPMSERVRPDLALRDVAGMLRSFDYVAGSIGLGGADRPVDAVRAWAADARRAFVQGYAGRSGADLEEHSELLAALEVDKAVYEAIYESRNRPTWVAIPLAAITRLVDGPTPLL
ncbi:MAG: aminoglycoside phosphotransferase [Microbacterium pygmaeum]